MSGAEVVAALGLLGKELLSYNRKNFEFDQDQLFEKEELRLKMQVERFKLFREDIRDLVELTVGKMDLYHMIGAFFAKMSIIYYCEGRIRGKIPPFLLMLYYMSASCSFIYLLLAIWLAMHASISAHSYGTRLLTRFVRLPIPSAAQMSLMNARYTDFEKHGKQMFRVPFLTKTANIWKPRTEEREGDRAKIRKKNDESLASDFPPTVKDEVDDELLQAADFRTERHVQLFQRLQGKWQCYDAYARVCVALGMRQMLQAITYYLIAVCMVENCAPTVALSLILAFQAASVLVCMLDIYHQMGCCGSWFYQVTGRCGNFDLQVSSVLPAFAAYLAMFMAPHGIDAADGPLEKKVANVTSIPCFVLEVIWFQLLLSVSKPTADDAALPRYWRTVLFMDVFSEGNDPMQVDITTGLKKLTMEERTAVEASVSAACTTLIRAQAAHRRWGVVPLEAPNKVQKETLSRSRKELKAWVSLLNDELRRRRLPELSQELKHPRSWHDLTHAERLEDPLSNSILGPFEHFVGMGMRSHYYYDIEKEQYRYKHDVGRLHVLTVSETVAICKKFKKAVAHVLDTAGDSQTRHAANEDEGDVPPQPRSISENSDEAGYGEFAASTAICSSEDDAGDERVPVTGSTSSFEMLRRTKPAVQVTSERLPWQIVRGLTRALQLIWAVMGSVMALESFGLVKIDHRTYSSEQRRLSSAHSAPHSQADFVSRLPLTETSLEIDWPYGSFFKPEALFCGDGSDDDFNATSPAFFNSGLHKTFPSGSLPIVVGGRSALYKMVPPGEGTNGKWRLRAFRTMWLPRGSAIVCSEAGSVSPTLTPREVSTEAGPLGQLHSGETPSIEAVPVKKRCLLVSPVEGGFVFHPWRGGTSSVQAGDGDKSILLHIGGSIAAARTALPWRLLVGAAVRCRTLPHGVSISDSNGVVHDDTGTQETRFGINVSRDAEWCLLLTGWIEGPRLIVAGVALPGGPGQLPAPNARVIPFFDLPFPTMAHAGCPNCAPWKRPSALHMQAGTGRLLAITTDGDLVAWELLRRPHLLGTWRLGWSLAQMKDGARAFAICGHPTGRVLVGGRDAAGPWLLQTQLQNDSMTDSVHEAVGSRDRESAIARAYADSEIDHGDSLFDVRFGHAGGGPS